MPKFELTIVTEGALSCDGEFCDDDCPIHGETAEPTTMKESE